MGSRRLNPTKGVRQPVNKKTNYIDQASLCRDSLETLLFQFPYDKKIASAWAIESEEPNVNTISQILYQPTVPTNVVNNLFSQLQPYKVDKAGVFQ